MNNIDGFDSNEFLNHVQHFMDSEFFPSEEWGQAGIRNISFFLFYAGTTILPIEERHTDAKKLIDGFKRYAVQQMSDGDSYPVVDKERFLDHIRAFKKSELFPADWAKSPFTDLANILLFAGTWVIPLTEENADFKELDDSFKKYMEHPMNDIKKAKVDTLVFFEALLKFVHHDSCLLEYKGNLIGTAAVLLLGEVMGEGYDLVAELLEERFIKIDVEAVAALERAREDLREHSPLFNDKLFGGDKDILKDWFAMISEFVDSDFAPGVVRGNYLAAVFILGTGGGHAQSVKAARYHKEISEKLKEFMAYKWMRS